MSLKTSCDLCGKTVLGIVGSLKLYDDEHLCSSCYRAKKHGRHIVSAQGVKCSLCSHEQITRHKIMTTASWLFVTVGIILTPFLVGFLLFLMAASSRKMEHLCLNCGNSF